MCINRLAYHADSLLRNMNNNAAEQYNSIVAKFVGGKRINYALKGSYEMRCEAAAISYNIPKEYYNEIHKSMTKKNSGKFTNMYVTKRIRNREYNRDYKKNKAHKHTKKLALPDHDYGPNVEVPDMLPEVYDKMVNNFLNQISCTDEDIIKIERDTVGQSNNSKWREQRLQRLTASWFGKICKQKRDTSAANTIKSILYSNFTGNAATKYGIEKEPLAKQEFEEKMKLKVQDCGLFVDKKYNYLAASPDGLVNSDCLVEIKCPSSACNFTPEEAIRQKKILFATMVDNKPQLKKNHDYYYQIQGQLHIANKKCCFFIIWTPLGISIEKVTRNVCMYIFRK